jgi:uncharacterized membrane protein YphA (DoxX/SURF4 family)
MNGKTIGYWVLTAVTALAFLGGGMGDVTHAAQVMEAMGKLGYPAYFATILGAWKLLGAVAILAPGFPRLKEWAYAGIFFDLSGAALSHASSGDPAVKIMTPLFILGFAMASWALRPSSRRLSSPSAAPSPSVGVAHARTATA